MVDKTDGGDLAADRNRGRRSSPESNRADVASPRADKRLMADFDLDSYAMVVYQANIKLDAAEAQLEYNTTPELRQLLAQAAVASTVGRCRVRRV
jgi:hypothetical protein